MIFSNCATKIIAAFGAIAWCLVSVGLEPARAANPDVKSGTCNESTAYKFVTSVVVDQTRSPTPAQMRNMSIDFKQGGNKPDCVRVTFSGDSIANAATFMHVMIVLDGDTAPCSPPSNLFVAGGGSESNGSSAAMTSICLAVTPGKHNVKIFWAANSSTGGAATAQNRTMTVHYIK